jgi:hypothetical protein
MGYTVVDSGAPAPAAAPDAGGYKVVDAPAGAPAQAAAAAAPGWSDSILGNAASYLLGGVDPTAPGFAGNVARQLALAARYGAQGLSGITDPINRLVGLKPARDVVASALDAAGLPTPQTPTERVVGDMSEGLTQAMALGGPVAAALRGAKAASATAGVGDALAANQGLSATGAAAGAGASGVAREAGLTPEAQLAAGLLGGFGVPALGMATAASLGAILRGARAYVRPFTDTGQRQIVGDTLGKFSSDPSAAADAMASAPEFVPGSNPTAAQASSDPGLLSLENTLRAQPDFGQAFTQRAAENNAARTAAFGDISGTPEDLASAIKARSAAATADYAAAGAAPLDLGTPGATPAPDSPFAKLVGLTDRPSFKQAWSKAENLAAENDMDPDAMTLSNPTFLHYIKMGFDDLLDAANPTTGIGKTQQRAIVNTKNEYLDALDSLNPAYGTARSNFAAASGPINRMETLQDIYRRTQLAAPDVLGNPVLSQAKFKSVTTNPDTAADLASMLSPEQQATMGGIQSDLDRASVAAGTRAPGSNTIQNLAMGHALGSAFGPLVESSPLAKILTHPLTLPYKWGGVDDQISGILRDAMLDPRMAAQLMRSMPQGMTQQGFLSLLGSRLGPLMRGGTVGAVSQSGSGQ